MGNPAQCTLLSDRLLKEKGHYVQAINYPTVPLGEEKLRLAPSPHHNHVMMDIFIKDLYDIWTSINLPLASRTATVSISVNEGHNIYVQFRTHTHHYLISTLAVFKF